MTDDRILTIPSEMLLGGYAVNLFRPYYKDYSLALKLYPGETKDNPQGPGYSVDEMLCAMCIRNPDGKEPDNNPKDAIQRFTEVEFTDKQFIVRTFISAFLMLQETQDEAESLGEALLASDPSSLSYTLTKDQLPWKSADLTFNRPTSGVQISVTKNYTSTKVNGALWEEMLFLTCLTHINGEPVAQVSNVISLVSELEVLDIQFAAAVFIKMFSLDMNKRKTATDLGKSWRTAQQQSSQSVKEKNVSKGGATKLPTTLTPSKVTT